ncbi:MAG: fumarylacetoacetate hydrolase family protein [Burkholderiaceae bacterium]|nr:fumarylacetoacetate hydrolase family protein [Burkholderiaceae bacterium]
MTAEQTINRTGYRPEGTVYGTLLNFRREQALWAGRAAAPPYNAPPAAPALYVKTANTFSESGAAIALAPDVEAVWVGVSLGLVMNNFESFWHQPSVKSSVSATETEASGRLPEGTGLVLLADLSVPHDSYYRPPVRFNCQDGFLGIGAQCLPLASIGDIAALKLELHINGALCQSVEMADLVRGPAELLADVLDFMTLQPGDVLMLGTDCLADGSRPLARVGDRFEIRAPGFAPLVHTLVREAA